MTRVDQAHFERWVSEIANAKGLGSSREIDSVRDSLRGALSNTYQAVACDIDGTLTRATSELAPRSMVDALRTLLRRGVRVILVTGRGGTAEDVVRQILQNIGEENLSARYLSRVHRLTDNGASILESSPEEPAEFVQRSLFRLPDAAALEQRIVDAISSQSLLRPERSRVRDERLRFEFRSESARDMVRGLIDSFRTSEPDLLRDVIVSTGIYKGEVFTIDVSPTTKGRALAKLCASVGVDPLRCLRIGDQGASDGNDADMLQVESGFSVGQFASTPTSCHLVVDESGQILAAEHATRYLLARLKFSAPLASPPTNIKKLRENLLAYEKEVAATAGREMRRVNQDFATSMGNLFTAEAAITARSDFSLQCYDKYSGAVRLSNWEVAQDEASEPLGQLFSLQAFDFSSKRPQSDWSMYSDSGILLRGPNYYLDWTREWEAQEQPLLRIMDEYIAFIGKGLSGIADQALRPPSTVRLKLLLAVMDNIQDLILKILHLAFALHSELDAGPDLDEIGRVANLASLHTGFIVRMHSQNVDDWETLHSRYFEAINEIYDEVLWYRHALAGAGVEVVDAGRTGPKLFRSRECDHLLESMAACQIGLEKHIEQHAPLREAPFAVVGLVYGGIELPFICEAIAASRGVEVVPGLASATSYTRKNVLQDESRLNLLSPQLNYWVADPGALNSHRDVDPPVLLADDNMTTARSLQHAWDSMQESGFDVLGGIVVRYPGVNRFVQMAEIDKSVPDPDLFMTFVRGLVAPAPYARLINGLAGSENRYLDSTGVFNKMNDRLKRYLEKHLGELLPGRG